MGGDRRIRGTVGALALGVGCSARFAAALDDFEAGVGKLDDVTAFESELVHHAYALDGYVQAPRPIIWAQVAPAGKCEAGESGTGRSQHACAILRIEVTGDNPRVLVGVHLDCQLEMEAGIPGAFDGLACAIVHLARHKRSTQGDELRAIRAVGQRSMGIVVRAYDSPQAGATHGVKDEPVDGHHAAGAIAPPKQHLAGEAAGAARGARSVGGLCCRRAVGYRAANGFLGAEHRADDDVPDEARFA